MASRASGVFSLNHLFKGSALYGSSDVVTAIVRFALIAVFTRIMPPAEFGLYSIIITTMTLAAVFIPLGIPSAVMLRLSPADPLGSKSCKDGAFSFLFQLCLICGVAFYAASVFIFHNPLITSLAPWLIVQAISDIAGMIPKVSLRIKEKIALFSTARVIRILLMAALLFSLLHRGVSGIKAVFMAESMSALAEWLLCMTFDRYFPAIPSFSCLGSLLKIGVPLTLVAFGMFCIDLSDRYVVFGLLGKEANGFYAAASKVALAASFFIEAFNSMWFPYYLRLMPANGPAIDENLRNFASRLIVLFSIVISLFMLVLPLFVKLQFFGRYFIAPQYHPVTVLVAPLTLAYFFKAAFYVSSTIIIAGGKNWKLARAVYIGAFVNIGLNVLWATLPAGANQLQTLIAIALSTSVSYGLCMVMASRSAGLFGVRFWLTSKGTLISAAALCLALAPVPLALRFGAWACIAVIAGRELLFVKRA
jgi:O-antigen/teichoic acid export membrane protein